MRQQEYLDFTLSSRSGATICGGQADEKNRLWLIR
jgi:hypothetical protein